jgi:HK97 family phage major capsid protein
MALGKRELRPHPLAKLIKVSRTLLRKATIGPEGLIRQRFGYKFGVVEETAFMTGSGQNQPLGLFTASANGVDTSRDVSTGNTTTAIASDNLLEVKYSLKIQHQTDEKTRWVFHRSAVKAIQQLKDGMGRYLWQTSIQEGKPDRLLDIPVVMSEYAPNTFTTGLYVGGLFNFRYYHIADALDMEMQRLDELYANTNQVGFIARKETDGMPVLAEAFARVKLA